MAILFLILAIGAAIATFIENDYGIQTAKILVYNHTWYEICMLLLALNILSVIIRFKMYKNISKFLLHSSFIVILIGAFITRYFGFEGIINIRENQTQNIMLSSEAYLKIVIEDNNKTYYQEYPLNFSKIGSNNFKYKINFNNKTLKIISKDYNFKKDPKSTIGIITLNANINNNEKNSKEFKIIGQLGVMGTSIIKKINNTKISISYGSKNIYLPFSIKLNDFELLRYPGSNSPSSYSSYITVSNKKDIFDYKIFMNTTLNIGNYLFFQNSYDPDEKGTILSVNNDLGKWPTYFGYFLLIMGFLLNLFDKKSRFFKLTSYIKKNQLSSLIIFILSLSTINLHSSQNFIQNSNNSINNINQSIYLKEFAKNSKNIASQFGKLVVQDTQGRMKPLNSLNIEILRKLSSKKSMFNLNADQIIMGMISNPTIWRDIKMIKIKTPKLKNILNIPLNENYIAFSKILKNNKYLIEEYVTKASQTKPNQRGTFEKDILNLDEKINIAYMVYNGSLLKIIPNRKNQKEENYKWYAPLEAIEIFKNEDKIAISSIIRGFINSIINKQYNDTSKYIEFIDIYQQKVGIDIIPSKRQIENEILFNKIDIFPKLSLIYVLIGILLFIYAFICIFNPKLKYKNINQIFFIIIYILFFTHTLSMAFRWIISGHAPWSDTYESLLYISWSALFAGILLFRKYIIALSAALIVASIFMFTAHLSHINPQITSLVPVLKSYWLIIHVSILAGSYGFLGLGAVLGLMNLIIFIFRDHKRKHLDEIIKQTSAINEISIIVGLSMLTIGNFLGGIWANESWGRYWGWDPKETWAYIAILIYALTIHLRFIKPFNNPYTFNLASVLAFSTILMTYFGVNFYLSGMHSYATGDPLPIPNWVYILTTCIFLTIIISFKNRDLKSIIK